MTQTSQDNILIPLPRLIDAFGTDLEFNKPMAQFSTYSTGGAARYFISVSSADEAVRAIRAAKRLDLPYFLLGGGSNILVSDKGFAGVVIKVDVVDLTLQGGDCIEVGAGVDLMALVNFATENSLAGLEFAAGIWGSVGGAIYGNAGAYGGEIKDVLVDVTIIDGENEARVVGPEYCQFAYRHSYFKESGEVIVSARIRLSPGEKSAIQAKVDDILASRSGKHPATSNNAGCFFKNIPDESQPYGKLPAGKLLDEIGAKEMSFGGAKVFEKHANIIVNCGTASSSDIRKLADNLKQRVLERFGIELVEEVQMVGEF